MSTFLLGVVAAFSCLSVLLSILILGVLKRVSDSSDAAAKSADAARLQAVEAMKGLNRLTQVISTIAQSSLPQIQMFEQGQKASWSKIDLIVQHSELTKTNITDLLEVLSRIESGISARPASSAVN